MVRIAQPGGESRKIRIRYTASRKYGLLAEARRLPASGRSLHSVAHELRVGSSNLSRWEQEKVGEMDPKDKLFKSKKMSAHPGPPGQLNAIDKPLLHYVFEQRKQGFVVNTLSIVLRASFLFPEFCEKSFTARCSAVKRWLVTHSMRF